MGLKKILFAFVLCSAPLPALADTCDAYARRATMLDHVEKNSLWCQSSHVSNYANHVTNCRKITLKKSRDIEARRIAEFGHCISGLKSEDCESYPHIATTQSRVANLLKCGFTGTQWSENWDHHKQFCEGSGGQLFIMNSLHTQRSAAIVACLAGFQPYY